MYECIHCNLFFEDKKALSTHQRSKKCTAHREIGFVCQKCFCFVKGYSSILDHVTSCKEHIPETEGVLVSLINQLSSKYSLELRYDDDTKTCGTISFTQRNNYTHPKNLDCGINVPPKMHLFQKTLSKYDDKQHIGSHDRYINDVYHKICRLSDTFQFMAVKYSFNDLMNVLWLETTTPCFHIKDDIIYILGKVQCQDEQDQKWFGDTFILEENEQIVKCVWYKDPRLKHFFAALAVLLKDVLNLYLDLGNWALNHKKIKLTPIKTTISEATSTLSSIMTEYNFNNLVDNIKILNSYETFYPIFKNLVEKKLKGSMLHTNIRHVFKDEDKDRLASPNEESLMNMSDRELTGSRYYLMHYILPKSEKKIFLSKE